MSERLLPAGRLNEAHSDQPKRGNMFLGVVGQFDKSTVPTDPTKRILQIPIPPDATGRPAYERDLLWPEARAKLKADHAVKVRANILLRDQLVTLCANDAEARRDDQILCSRDPVYWINHWVCVIDPRLGEKATIDPFVLYETQEREARFFVDEFLAADNMLWLIEKSRAWGATWLMVALTVWGFLYRENWNVLVGAPNQTDVDRGGMASDHNSIFGKIRFLLRHLPPWQVPDGLLTKSTLNKNFLIKHPTKDNALHGRQYCSNWGRSLRFLYTLADEAAHSLNYAAASVNYSNTSDRNIALSTHKGTGTEFAKMVNMAKEDPSSEVVVHTLFWAESPLLDADWYWALRQTNGWEKTAQERDIDQQGSVGFAVYQDFDIAINVLTVRREILGPDGAVLVEAREEMDYDPMLPLGVSVDPGMGPDPFALVWWQPDRASKLINIIDAIQYEGRPGPYFVPYLLGYAPELTLDKRPWAELYEYDPEEWEIIRRHARWGALDPWLCYGDTYGGSAATKVASGLSIYETWAEYGVPLMCNVKITNKEESVQRAAAILGRTRIAGRLLTQRTQSKQTPTFVQAITQYSWVNRESPQGLPLARVPRHDKYCHYNDCYQFIAKYEDPNDPSVQPLVPEKLRDGPSARFRSPHASFSPPSTYSTTKGPE